MNPCKEKSETELDLLNMAMHLSTCPYLTGEDMVMVVQLSKFLLTIS